MPVPLSTREVSRVTEIGLPRLKLWRQRGLVARPYNTMKTLSLAVGCYFADRGLPFEIVRVAVATVAGRSEEELRDHFARGETRLTIDTDTRECAIETPRAVARRVVTDDARIFSIPLRTDYERLRLRLNIPAA